MPGLSGKLVADFESFLKAVDTVQGKLRGFESGAEQVSKSLARMGDSFSGVKIIQEANLLTKAINDGGGAATLTAKEMARVNSTVTEAIAKYKALGQSAPPAMQALADATTKVEPPMASANRAAALLQSTFAQFTLAGLATGAIQKLGAGMMEFVELGKKLPAIESAFGRLTAGLKQNGDEMLANMGAATQGLVSDFDLMQTANKAMLLGLPVTADAMGELAKTATVLGKAMGQDATTSLNDLIVALGRSSPMILDNLGLTVKVGEANEAYAVKLGKTVEQMSDAEKKMAFYEAAMEAARKKTAELGEQTKTLGEIMQTVWVKVGNVVTGAVASLNTGIGAILTNTKQFALFLTDMAHLGIGAAVQMAALREQAGALKPKLDIMLPKDLPAKIDDLPKKLKPAAEAVKKVKEEVDKLLPSQNTWALGIGQLERRIPDLTRRTEEMAASFQELRTWVAPLASVDLPALNKQILLLPNVAPGMAKQIKDATAATETATDRTDDWSGALITLAGTFQQLATIQGDSFSEINRHIGTAISMANALEQAIHKINAAGATAGQKLQGAADIAGITFTLIMMAIQKSRDNAARLSAELFKMHFSKEWETSVKFSEQLVENVKKLGTALNINNIVKELGGVSKLTADQLTHVMDQVHTLFALIQRGGGDAVLAMEELQQLYDDLVPSLQDVEEAASFFGLTLDQLGPKVRQLQIDEEAKKAADAFALLQSMGVDTSTIIVNMSDEVRKSFVKMAQDAVKFNLTIPESMKPILQGLLENGDLVDDLGNQFKDLSSFNFTKPLEKMVDDLIAKIKELIDTLLGIPKQVPLPYVPGTSPVLRTDNPFPVVEGGPQAVGGDYLVRRPTHFLAGEAGAERVTFTPQGGGRGGGRGGGPLVIITKTYLDDREIAQALTKVAA